MQNYPSLPRGEARPGRRESSALALVQYGLVVRTAVCKFLDFAARGRRGIVEQEQQPRASLERSSSWGR